MNRMLRPHIIAGSPRVGRAFSLHELVIVLAIITVLGAIAVPRYSSAISRQRAESAAKRIAADLNMARQRAVHGSQGTTVTFTGSGYVITGARHLDHWAQVYQVDLDADPYKARILAAEFGGDAVVKFDIHGSPDSGGAVVVSAGGWQHTVTLSESTGESKAE